MASMSEMDQLKALHQSGAIDAVLFARMATELLQAQQLSQQAPPLEENGPEEAADDQEASENELLVDEDGMAYEPDNARTATFRIAPLIHSFPNFACGCSR